MLGFRLSLHRPTGELCSIFDEAAYRLRRDKVATWGNLRDEVGSGGGADGGIVAAYIVTATSRPINKSEGDEWWRCVPLKFVRPCPTVNPYTLAN